MSLVVSLENHFKNNVWTGKDAWKGPRERARAKCVAGGGDRVCPRAGAAAPCCETSGPVWTIGF